MSQATLTNAYIQSDDQSTNNKAKVRYKRITIGIASAYILYDQLSFYLI